MMPAPLRGAAARALWLLEPDMTFLNHGSFGATPRSVLAAQDTIRLAMERQPVRFFTAEAPALLRQSAAVLASFLGARGEDLAFVDNATTGVNAVLRSVALAPGDEVLTTSYVYAAVRNTVRAACERVGARAVEVGAPLPVSGPDEVVEAVKQGFSDRTRLLVVDHVCSMSALRLPVERIVALATERGVPVLIDGAHAPGMIDLDVPALGAAWYTGNCHKWLCAAKGTAFLWARPGAAQDVLRSHVTSHHWGQPFPAEFDMIGTRDFSPWLSVGAALEFHEAMGGAALRADNRSLAFRGAGRLAEAWGRVLPGPAEMFGSIVPVEAPGGLRADEPTARAMHDGLWVRHRIEVPVYAFQGRLWIRASAQAYNEIGEYDRLAAAALELARILAPSTRAP